MVLATRSDVSRMGGAVGVVLGTGSDVSRIVGVVLATRSDVSRLEVTSAGWEGLWVWF